MNASIVMLALFILMLIVGAGKATIKLVRVYRKDKNGS